jgi:acetylornithine/succinyldiaminopimelate/putrescine aminotransferase
MIGIYINGEQAQKQGNLPDTAAAFIGKLREHQVLALPAGPHVLRVLPPLTVTDDEIHQFITAIEAVLEGTDK